MVEVEITIALLHVAVDSFHRRHAGRFDVVIPVFLRTVAFQDLFAAVRITLLIGTGVGELILIHLFLIHLLEMSDEVLGISSVKAEKRLDFSLDGVYLVGDAARLGDSELNTVESAHIAFDNAIGARVDTVVLLSSNLTRHESGDIKVLNRFHHKSIDGNCGAIALVDLQGDARTLQN